MKNGKKMEKVDLLKFGGKIDIDDPLDLNLENFESYIFLRLLHPILPLFLFI